MELIRMEDVAVQYVKQKPVVEHVNLSFEKGSITAFLGPNGSGKTTLMSTLNQLIRPCSGKILIDGQDIGSLSHKQLARQIATVPQANTPGFSYSVYDMIMLGRAPYISYLPREEDKAVVEKVIDRFGIRFLRDKAFDRLSGGERQMVMIARSIAQSTPIVLMDEPATYLDLRNQARILTCVREINEQDGVTFIITLHDPNHALFLADEVVLVQNGGAVKGPTGELLTEETVRSLYHVDSAMVPKFGKRCMLVNYQLPSAGNGEEDNGNRF